MADIKYLLEKGIAHASFGYRLIETNKTDTIGVIKCLTDCKNALQVIRYYSKSLKINPAQIALTGSSAGAGTSLWLATKSEMADSNSSNPINKESTRVCAAAIFNSQATYDLYKWETTVYNNYDGNGSNYTMDSMVNLLGFQTFSNFYGGIDSINQILYDPQLIKYRNNLDMLNNFTSDDPPRYINCQSKATHPSQDIFHHSLQSKVIFEEAVKSSLPEVKCIIPYIGINTTQGESINDFLIRNLSTCTSVIPNYYEIPRLHPEIEIYPNPFSVSTEFRWNILQDSHTSLVIYDALGNIVKTLINNRLPKGQQNHVFQSDHLPSGTYFYHLTIDSRIKTGKLIIIK